MKNLLKLAKQETDEAELYSIYTKIIPINFKNGKLKEIEIKEKREYALRIIRNKKIGMSFSTSLDEPNRILKEAIETAKFGKLAKFNLPNEKVANHNNYDNYDENLKNVEIDNVINDCINSIRYIRNNGIDTPIDYEVRLSINEINILNTNGLELNHKFSSMINHLEIILPDSCGGPYIEDYHFTYRKIEKDQLDKLLQEYNIAKSKLEVPTKKMKVLFTPHAMYIITMRINKAISGYSLVQHISPLENKINKKVFDEKISIYDNPTIKNYPDSRPFDDEGVKTKIIPIVEKGVFKNFIFDLATAAEYGVNSTGNGYKKGFWTSGIATPVSPNPCHLTFSTGEISLNEQINSIDEGIILDTPLGAHSGNIPKGDFSVNVGLGYYVKNGKIKGRVTNTLVSGNIYEILQNVISISKEVDVHNIPWVLFNNVSIAGAKN